MIIMENEEVLRCNHSEGQFRLPFSHIIEEKWYSFHLSYENNEPGLSYAAIVSDHLQLSPQALSLLKTGDIEGEVYQQVSLPKIDSHEDIALVYGYNLEIEESEGEESVRDLLPGSFVREVYYASKATNFDQAFEHRHMEKLFIPQVHAYYPLNDLALPGNKFSQYAKEPVANVEIKEVQEGVNNDVCRYSAEAENVLQVGKFNFFDSLTLSKSSKKKT